MFKRSKVFRPFFAFLMAFAVMAGIPAAHVYAAAPGIYVADCTPHYRHPQTGVIEDAGGEGSYALGQSMTEGATGPQALVEVDEAGNTYITIRLYLMDNISDVSFLIDGGQADPMLVKQDAANNSADYRMLVFSENSVITTSIYVAPMGRYVTYYITVSNLQPGSADFTPMITVSEPAAVAEETPAEPVEQPAPAAETETVPEPTAEAAPEVTEEPTPEVTEEPAAEEAEPSKGGLQEFDAEGNEVAEEKEEPEKAEEKEEKSGFGMIAGVVVIVLLIASGIWVFISKKKQK